MELLHSNGNRVNAKNIRRQIIPHKDTIETFELNALLFNSENDFISDLME